MELTPYDLLPPLQNGHDRLFVPRQEIRAFAMTALLVG